MIKFLLCEVGAHKVFTIIQACILLKFKNEISRTKISRAHMNKISRDNSQCSPHNIQKCQVAKALVEDDRIQDLTNHKQTDE